MAIPQAGNKFPGWSSCPVRVSPIARPREEKDADKVEKKPLEMSFPLLPFLLWRSALRLSCLEPCSMPKEILGQGVERTAGWARRRSIHAFKWGVSVPMDVP